MNSRRTPTQVAVRERSPARKSAAQELPERKAATPDWTSTRQQAPPQQAQSLVLAKQLQSVQQQMLSQHQLIQQKQQELAHIQQMTQSLHQENDQLQSKYRQSRKDVLTTQQQLVESQLQFESQLKEQTEDFAQQFSQLQQKNKQLKTKIKEYEALTAQLSAKTTELAMQINDAEEKAERHQQRHAERYDKLQESYNQLKAKYQQKDDEISAAKRECCAKEIELERIAEQLKQQHRGVTTELETQLEKLRAELRQQKLFAQDQQNAAELEHKAKMALAIEQEEQQLQTARLKIQELEQINLALKSSLRQEVQNGQQEQDRLKLLLQQKQHELELHNNEVQTELRKRQGEIQFQSESLGMQFQARQSDMEKQFNAAISQYNMRIQTIQASCDQKVAEQRRIQIKQEQQLAQLRRQLKEQDVDFSQQKARLQQQIDELQLKNKRLAAQNQTQQLSERQTVLNQLKQLQINVQFIKGDILSCKNMFQQVTLPSHSHLQQIVALATSRAPGSQLLSAALTARAENPDSAEDIIQAYQQEISVLGQKLELEQSERRQKTQIMQKEAAYQNQQISAQLLGIQAVVQQQDADIQQAALALDILARTVSQLQVQERDGASVPSHILGELRTAMRQRTTFDASSMQLNWIQRSAAAPAVAEAEAPQGANFKELLDGLLENRPFSRLEGQSPQLADSYERIRHALHRQADFDALKQITQRMLSESQLAEKHTANAHVALGSLQTLNNSMRREIRVPGEE